MDKEKTHFLEPGDTFIIVRKLTKEIIKTRLKTQLHALIGLYFAAKGYIYLSTLGGKQMHQNNLSFESENLVVDYISFNISGFIDLASIHKIAL